MNNLILFGISIVIFLIFYYYVNKTKEHFSDNNEEDTNNDDEVDELIKKHQIGYADKIYDTKYLFQVDGNLMKTNKQISFWNPITDIGLYSVGTAISDNLEMPNQPYTILEGPALINPEKYEMIYRHGNNIRVIEETIHGIENELGTRPETDNPSDPLKGYSGLYQEKRKYEDYIGIYDQTDMRYHVCEVYAVHNREEIHYPVPNASHWSSRRHDYKYYHYPSEWHRYRDRGIFGGLSHVLIPPYLTIDIKTYKRDKYNRWVEEKITVDGWSHWKDRETTGIQYLNVGQSNPDDLRTNEKRKRKSEVRTLRPNEINISAILNNDMRHDNEYSNVKKNPSVRLFWKNKLDEVNKKIKEKEDLLAARRKEINQGLFTIWRPIPPEGYRSFGDLIMSGHNKPMLTDVKCVPERCSKGTRNWKLDDRKLILEKGDIRLNFFKNPFHITVHMFIEKRVDNRWEWQGENPEETKIYRAYPCVPECDYVDGLVDANACAKNMCSNRKKELDTTVLRHSKSDTEAENMILDEIKQQDLLLEQLKQTAKELEMNQNKFDIINKEFNRHEMQHFLKNKGQLHRDTINKLMKSKSGVAVNINSPGGIEALKALLKDYLLHHANALKKKQQGDSGTNQGKSCTNWTDFKQNHRCKYSDPPCFGCVNPN